MDLPDPVRRAAAGMIRDMNDIIENYAREYGYKAADLAASDISEHVQSDGVHPDQTGQEKIAEIVYGCLQHERCRETSAEPGGEEPQEGQAQKTVTFPTQNVHRRLLPY